MVGATARKISARGARSPHRYPAVASRGKPNLPPCRILDQMTTRPAAQRRHLATSPFKAQVERPVEQFAVADRVTHAEYGLGRVVSQDAAGVTVDFGSRQVRIPTPFPRLRKL